MKTEKAQAIAEALSRALAYGKSIKIKVRGDSGRVDFFVGNTRLDYYIDVYDMLDEFGIDIPEVELDR